MYELYKKKLGILMFFIYIQQKVEVPEPDFFDQANLKNINNIQFNNVIKADNQKKTKEPALNVLEKFK